MLRFEKGGIRRVLMNVFGNSLKFTKVTSLLVSEKVSLSAETYLVY